MNLKEHNDIVQKLLGQMQLKDKQIAKLNKQITAISKSSTSTQGKSKVPSPSQIQKQVQKRISQLSKQHNAKVAQLNQQIKTLTQENNQLKQRLALKNNLDHKQKQHIAQVIKKNIDRKPGSQHDIKITSLVTHYQAQLNKKNTYIQTLKRQVKSLSMNQAGSNNNENGKKGQLVETKISGMEFDEGSEDNTQRGNEERNRKMVPVLEHNEKIQTLQKMIKTLQEKEQKKNTELIDLRNKYNELTKQYYRVLNQYGIQAASITSKTDKPNNNTKKLQPNQLKLQSSQLSKTSKPNNKDSRISFNLTDDQQQNLYPQSFASMADPNQASISIDFEQKFKKFSQRPKLFPQQQQQDQEDNLQNNILSQQNLVVSTKTTLKPFHKHTQKVFQKLSNPQFVQSILQLLNLTQQEQILPELNNLMTKQSFIQLNEKIIKVIHEILYKFGMGKVSRSQMPQSLEVFSSKCSTWLESYDLINQICIELGAKRNKLMEKIAYYKNSQLQYLQKIKNITFLTQLNKSHKLLEFINFFQLDKSQLQLPQQLKNIHQQLKYVDKFIKQAHMTMALTQRKNLQDMLQLILRKIQTYHEWEVELRKQNQRKTSNKHSAKSSIVNNDKS